MYLGLKQHLDLDENFRRLIFTIKSLILIIPKRAVLSHQSCKIYQIGVILLLL